MLLILFINFNGKSCRSFISSIEICSKLVSLLLKVYIFMFSPSDFMNHSFDCDGYDWMPVTQRSCYNVQQIISRDLPDYLMTVRKLLTEDIAEVTKVNFSGFIQTEIIEYFLSKVNSQVCPVIDERDSGYTSRK